MVSFRKLKAKISGLFLRGRLDRRIEEELQTHLELLIEEEERRGMSASDARRIARLRLGGLDQTKESVRDARAFWLESSWKDVCYAWCRVSSSPLFSIFAVVTLALGIGATAAIYSIIDFVLGPPAGVRNIESIVNVYHWPVRVPANGLSYGDYLDLRSRQTVFQDVTAWTSFGPSFTANGHSERSLAEIVGGSYFQVLGVNAEIGRTLQPADDSPGAPPVIVISHGVWQRMFAGAPDIVGRTLKISGRSFEIVGVAPSQFCSANGLIQSSFWVPLEACRLLPDTLGLRPLTANQRSQRWLRVKGRLKPGISLAEAAAEVRGIGAQLDLAFPIGTDHRRRPESFETSRKWSVRPAADVRVDESYDQVIGPMSWTIMAAVVLVLLVACTNIANLMLARTWGRRHELTIRLALGASRWNLVRGLLAECGVLAVAGSIAGVGVARGMIVLVVNDLSVKFGIPLHFVPKLNFAAITVSALATVLALVVAGLVPALQSTRADLRSGLATDAFHGAGPRWKGRRALIGAQVAVSVILLSITALCISQVRQQSQSCDFDVDQLAVALVNFSDQGYDESRTQRVVVAVLQQMRSRHDVEAVAATSGLPPVDVPIGWATPQCWLDPGGQDRLLTAMLAGTPGVFQTMGTSISRGRAFDSGDTSGAAPVIVINESAARKLFGTDNVVGRELNFQRQRWGAELEYPVQTRRIIGITADRSTRPVPLVYVPLDQQFEPFLALSVRAGQNPEKLVGPLRQSLRSADPELAVTQAGTGPAIVFGLSARYPQIMAAVAGALGGFALVLALAGLYGVLSHVVSRRTWEVGVRMSLGATPAGVIGMVLRDGLRPVVVGILAGSAVGATARLLIQPQLASMLPRQNVIALISVPVLMLTAALVACYLPAHRAARVNPNAALREL